MQSFSFSYAAKNVQFILKRCFSASWRTTSESTKQTPDTSSRSVIEEGFKKKQKWVSKIVDRLWNAGKSMEEYNPGKSLWKGRSVENDAEFRIKSETHERHDPLKVKRTIKYCSIVSVNVMKCMIVSRCYYMSGNVRTLR